MLGLGERRGWEGLCRVQVYSEQVGLESFWEAVERLCHPDVSRELIPPLRCQNRVGTWRSDVCLFLVKVVPVVQPKLLSGVLGGLNGVGSE